MDPFSYVKNYWVTTNVGEMYTVAKHSGSHESHESQPIALYNQELIMRQSETHGVKKN